MGVPVNPNHGPQRTASGRLIIAGNISFPYTDDPTGLAGWRMTGIYPQGMAATIKDDPASFWEVAKQQGWSAALCEGSFYQTDDGVLQDVLIVVANDQFVNFFWNNIPTFLVTLADEVKGQFTRHKFHYRNHKEFGRPIVRAGMEHGVDFSFGQYVELQHTQTVPLYFVLPEPTIPILPIYVNTWVDPAPTPRRCYQVGELIRGVADGSAERVAVLATGGLSHYPGSPRIGEIDTPFDHKLLEMMRAGNGRSLTEYSVADPLEAGDTEFLNWMVLLGAVGEAKASYTSYMPDLVATGWGFASWKLL